MSQEAKHYVVGMIKHETGEIKKLTYGVSYTSLQAIQRAKELNETQKFALTALDFDEYVAYSPISD